MKTKLTMLLLVAFLPSALFASEGGETDIFQRTVNFLIFISILWYLLADKARDFFANRSSEIQSELEKVQELVKASKKAKEDALLKVEEARKTAEDIVETSKKELHILKDKMQKQLNDELDYMDRQYEEQIDAIARNKTREIVEEIVSGMFDDKDTKVDQADLVNIIAKKVA